jgi:hypothetical protein
MASRRCQKRASRQLLYIVLGFALAGLAGSSLSSQILSRALTFGFNPQKAKPGCAAGVLSASLAKRPKPTVKRRLLFFVARKSRQAIIVLFYWPCLCH